MTDVDRDFCKIFIRADSGPAAALLQHVLDGQFQDKIMTLPVAEVEVRRNPDAGAAESFLGWLTILEIEAGERADRAAVVGLVSGIITALWEAGIPAVAACDYERDLPWRGGIGRLHDAPEG